MNFAPRYLNSTKPTSRAQLVMFLLGIYAMFTCGALAQDEKRPDVGAAMAILTYYYAPLLGASLPERHPDLARVFGAIASANSGRPGQALAELDEIAGDTSFSSRGQALALLLKARLEADRNLQPDGRYPGHRDAQLDRPTAGQPRVPHMRRSGHTLKVKARSHRAQSTRSKHSARFLSDVCAKIRFIYGRKLEKRC